MKHYRSPDKCTDCGCRATGIHATDSEGRTFIKYDPPAADCACRCHDAWRMVHRTPAIGAAA
jgi:hypothetical protein